ncbi:MAG: hypothetical protein J1E80_07055 [Desulfovibrionaceae bacterium]|nr:hypothetical protein [Desulfovibrionaceae bacterium]
MNREAYFSCRAPAASAPEAAVDQVRQSLLAQLDEAGLEPSSVVLLRFFCSDVYTQAPLIERVWPDDFLCQRIFVGQTPLDSAYMSLQAYCIKTARKQRESDGSLVVRHGGYQSLWTLHYPPAPDNSRAQSDAVIESWHKVLRHHGLALDRDVVRTWYYVRDIDNNYAGMVQSRVAHYEASGLTPDTHFIASTGIEACAPDPHALVWLHGHAELGLRPEQITYLKALDHLSPTHVYGVNFERATRITYGDRVHCRVSGTASIDSEGRVLHRGDVMRQCERAVENVDALLREGGMELRHLRAATVYLRDGHDYPRLAALAQQLLPASCAVNVTRGPVCRPDWLVEIEGEAIAPCQSSFAPFV